MVDLFATDMNISFQDPIGFNQDTYSQSWDHLHLYAFPLFGLIRRFLNIVLTSRDHLSIIVALATQKVVSRPFVLAGGKAPPSVVNLGPRGSTSHQEVSSRPEHPQPTCLEVVQ